MVANPINTTNGNKYQEEEDFNYSMSGSDLRFARYYNSILDDAVYDGIGHANYGPFGSCKWSHNFNTFIVNPSGYKVKVRWYDGEFLYFSKDPEGVNYHPITNPDYALLKDSTGFDLTYKDGTKYRFDLAGKLTGITDEKGNVTTIGTAGSTTTVTDPFGRTVQIHYDTNNRIDYVIDPYGKTYTYTYETANGIAHLKAVGYPDSKTVTYGYNNTSFPHHLTTRTDENNHVKTWGYDDANGMANSYNNGEGLEISVLDYSTPGQTVVTSGENRTRTYTHHKNSGGKNLVDSVTGCTSCGSASYTYYTGSQGLFNNISTATDRNGNITHYSNYDTKGNPGTVVEASNRANPRTTYYTYNTVTSEPASVKRKSALPFSGYSTASAEYRYDGFNNLTGVVRIGNTRDVEGSLSSFVYANHHRYNSHGSMTESVDPLGRKVTFGYYSTTWGNPNHGQIKSITNHLGHVVSFGNYSSGKAGRTVDANGILTQNVYDLRGRLKAVTAHTRTTRYGYDAFGNMTAMTLPRGNRVGYEYDGANRLVNIRDGLGNYIQYVYDTEGNRTREEIRDSSGSLKKYQDMRYDANNRLEKALFGSYSSVIGYDGNGNVTSKKDYNGNIVSYVYDALDRLTNTIQPGNVNTAYTHDINNNVTSLTDGNGNATGYVYDDLGRLVETNSPDTGLTRYEYDAAGNLVKKKDAKGTLITYEYDALNRLTAVHFPDSAQDIAYSYDSASVSFGIGRLTGMSDPSGATTFFYDEYGNVVKEEKTFAGLSALVTQYSYDGNGNLETMTYPDGRVLTYTYDDVDQVTNVAGDKDGTHKTFAGNISHAPFGGIASFTYGNGLTARRDYDTQHRLTYLKSGPFLRRDYVSDPDGNITGITDLVNSAKNQTFGYDALNRLTSATGVYGSVSYEYDQVGNRTKKTWGAGVTDYAYVVGKNRLDHTTGAEAATYGHDDNGNMTSDGTLSYEYAGGGTPFVPVVENLMKPEPNVYPYTGNNPVTYIDPLGLFYYDLNISIGTPWFVGITFGYMSNSSGIHPYFGGGVVTPGAGGAITFSPYNPARGWNVGFQGEFGIAGQVGYGFRKDGGWYWEGGVGGSFPTIGGASLTGFYVFKPIKRNGQKGPCK